MSNNDDINTKKGSLTSQLDVDAFPSTSSIIVEEDSNNIVNIGDVVCVNKDVIDRLNSVNGYLKLRDMSIECMEEIVDITSKLPEYSWLTVSYCCHLRVIQFKITNHVSRIH